MKKLYLYLASAAVGVAVIGMSVTPPRAEIQDWSTTAGSNNSSAPNGFPESMAPSGVNNSARELMAQVRRWAEQIISGTYGATTGEASNAYSITPDIYPSALTPGATYTFQASTTNTGAATLEVASLGAKGLQSGGAALSSGDITENDWIEVVYDGHVFQIVSNTGTAGVTAVAKGGTGAGTLTDGGVLLGSGTAAITAMAALADGALIVGDGTTDPVAESGATLRTSVGVGTGDSPQLTGVELGHATDTTITRASAGDANIEGNIIYRASGTDVPATDGGTGVSTLTDGGVLLGSGTGAVTALAALADGELIVGDGTTDPVAESGATLRTSIGVGTGDSVSFTGLTATGAFTSLGIDDNASETAITISAGEEVSMGKQPAFHATAAAVTNVTGNGTLYTIVYGTEVYDQSADFATSTFTAPITGVYTLGGILYLGGITSSATTLNLRVITSNRTYTVQNVDLQGIVASAEAAVPWSVEIDMDASDTATVAVRVSGEGSDVIDLPTGSVVKNIFWGRLAV